MAEDSSCVQDKKIVESKLGLKNAQIGFPLLPVTAPEGDILLEKTCNIGFFHFLAEKAQNSKDWKKLEALKLDKGLPYLITDVGKRVDASECSYPVGKMLEVREIERVRNDLYYETGHGGEPEKSLASIIYVPLVSDIPWRQLCI